MPMAATVTMVSAAAAVTRLLSGRTENWATIRKAADQQHDTDNDPATVNLHSLLPFSWNDGDEWFNFSMKRPSVTRPNGEFDLSRADAFAPNTGRTVTN